MSGPSSGPSPNSTTANHGPNFNKYPRHLNKNKDHPERIRSSQPDLSWLGDDDFESTGLAFKLARHHTQHPAANKPTGGFGSSTSPNWNANSGPGLRKNDERVRTRPATSNNADRKPSRPKKFTFQKSQPKQADATAKAETPEAVRPRVSKKPATARSTLNPTPIPQSPVRIDPQSTDIMSLFGTSPPIFVAPPSTSTETIPTDDASRRAQFALEYYGGDYSKFVSNSLVTSEDDPSVYAKSTMARRRDLGPNTKNNALGLIRGMIGKSQNLQPTT